jgi:hypothetical protein
MFSLVLPQRISIPARINGFQILRKSLWGQEPYGRICRFGTKEYRGIRRPHLESLYETAELYPELKLPEEIGWIIMQSNDQSNDSVHMQIIRDFEDAYKVFKYFNKGKDLDDLIVLYSDTVTEARGAFDFDAKEVEWLGYDLCSLGGWSFILDGIFFRPNYFEKWMGVLNENGLFPSDKGIKQFVEDYAELSRENLVEPYDPSDSDQIIHMIRVGRVLL